MLYCDNPKDIEYCMDCILYDYDNDGCFIGYLKENQKCPIQTWHYTEDELPQESGWYLTFFSNNTREIYYDVMINYFLKENNIWSCNNIIAWMKIPNPPKDINKQ